MGLPQVIEHFKPITTAVYYLLRHKNVSYRGKIKLCLYFSEIKEVFRIY
jgi:hypothetical protein